MPGVKKFNRPQLFGNDCVFAITDFQGFLGALTPEYVTITGTLVESSTPWGTGIEVSVANSYMLIDWTSQTPIATDERSIFSLAYFPAVVDPYVHVSWGTNVARNGTFLGLVNSDFWGGLSSDNDNGGVINIGWSTFGLTNEGINGGDNIVYGNGAQAVAGTNAAAAVTTDTNLNIFQHINNGFRCPVGTILQELIIFNRVLSADEILHLHNRVMGLVMNP